MMTDFHPRSPTLPPHNTECESYTDVYRRYGLLHERAYFAHCCHCGSDEQELLKVNKAGCVWPSRLV